MPRPEETCTTCDSCGETTEDAVSVHMPIKGGKSPLDFCPSCAQDEMQRMADRLGSEHGSAKVLEVKSRQAQSGPRGVGKAADRGADDEEE